MHILWIKTELLHPVDKGGRIRTYQMLRALKERHQVTYLALDNGRAPADAAPRASEYCHELVRVPFREPERASPGFWFDLALNAFSSMPFAIGRYRSPAMRSEIQRLVARGDVDVVVCDFLMPSQNVPGGFDCPTVLFQHNVEAVIWERHTEVQANPLARAYFKSQWRRMVRFEREQCRRFDQVVAVSESDAEIFRNAYGAERVEAVPTGVDTDYFAPMDLPPEPGHLVFVGAMDWLPNSDGITWFVRDVLPLVRKAVPGARVSIVGRNPGTAVRRLAEAHEGVEVTGAVPDVRPYLARGSAVVVPLRVGGGTRLKIYEAMAAGRPLVSTSVGAEGLPLEPNEHYLAADSAPDLAEACIKLLRDPAAAEAMAKRGSEFVRGHFGWARVAEQFAGICDEVANRRQPGAGVPA